MIAVDTNILVYAHRQETREHQKAFDTLERLYCGSTTWFVAWPSIYEFLRVVTHPLIFSPPTSRETSLEFVRYLFASPSFRAISHRDDHLSALENATHASRAAGNLFFDAQIAAILREWGVREFYTHDRDFVKFHDLKVIDPCE